MSLTILGIESSCDDTSAAVIRDEYLLSNVMASQEVHRRYGGVVPELASRAHQQNIVPVVSQALEQAGVTLCKSHANGAVIASDVMEQLKTDIRALQKQYEERLKR